MDIFTKFCKARSDEITTIFGMCAPGSRNDPSVPASSQMNSHGDFVPPPMMRKKTLAIIEETTKRSLRREMSVGGRGVTAPMSPKTQQVLYEALKRHFLFSSLGEEVVRTALFHFSCVTIDTGAVCIRQGDDGDHFYVLEDGCLGVIVNGEEMDHTMNPGDYFGDLALLYNHPRSATIFAKKESRLWSLDREHFRQIVLETQTTESASLAKMKENPLFFGFSDEDLSNMFRCFEQQEYQEEQIIFTQGDANNTDFFLIFSGRVRLQQQGAEGKDVTLSRRPLKPGDFFGENYLLNQSPRNCTATMAAEGTLWVLRLNNCDQNLVTNLRQNIQASFRIRSLKSVPIFQKLPEQQILALAKAMTEVEVGEKSVLIRQGDPGDAFYVVLKGSVAVTVGEPGSSSQKILTTLLPGDFMGEIALLLDVKRTANAIATKPSTVLKLHKDDFNSILSEETKRTLLGIMRTNEESQERRRFLAGDMLVGPEIAQAPYSVVRLARHRVVGEVYAVKVIKKSLLTKKRWKKAIKAEKDALKTIDSAFVVQMKQVLSTNNHTLLVMELVDGVDLSQAIHHLGKKIPLTTVKLWAGMVLLGLHDLHESDIVWRDLKPENMLLDRKGYIYLSNFGTATALAAGARTFTVTGTADYMAPEVILGKGHDETADYWSFGIFMFELLMGFLPFSHNEKDGQAKSRMQIMESIANSEVSYPSRFPAAAKEFVAALLKKSPILRLGKNGISEIMNHSFFEGLNWDKLRTKELTAPFIPPSKMCKRDSIPSSSSSQWKPLSTEYD